MTLTRLFLTSLLLAMVSVITSCSSSPKVEHLIIDNRSVPKDWQQSAASDTQANQQLSRVVTRLTDLVELDGLDRTLEKALEHNPDLQQTALALRIAEEQVGVSSAELLPTANLGLEHNAKQDQEKQYNASISVSWTLDLSQKLRDNKLAGIAEFAASAASYQGARDLLAANIINAHLSLVREQQLISIERNKLEVLQQNELAIVERYRQGLGTLVELDTARANTESSRASLVSLTENLAVTKRRFNLLMGGEGFTEIALVDSLATQFPKVMAPLTTLPNQDLARRPDLQQAYQQIISSEYQAKIAYKALLPELSITASLTDSSGNLSQALFKDPVWAVLSRLTAPLFQGGKLKAQAKIAELTKEQSYWQYQSILLTAVNEIQNALAQERALVKQQQHIQLALENAVRSSVIYREKYRQGLVTILDLLQIQQQSFSLQSQLTELTYQVLANRINLGLALGLGV